MVPRFREKEAEDTGVRTLWNAVQKEILAAILPMYRTTPINAWQRLVGEPPLFVAGRWRWEVGK